MRISSWHLRPHLPATACWVEMHDVFGLASWIAEVMHRDSAAGFLRQSFPIHPTPFDQEVAADLGDTTIVVVDE